MDKLTEPPRITIRRAEPGDYEAVHRILSSPRVYPGMLQLPYPSLEHWRKRMADPPEGLYNLLACAGAEVVGQLALHTFPNSPRRRHAGQIGMAVREDWHGQGVGTALMQAAIDLADRWLNLTRLELDVYVDNAAAIRLYQKFGFVIEGTLVQYAFRDGAYVDTYAMARLRPLGRDASRPYGRNRGILTAVSICRNVSSGM
jgi:putative acetyltransferase